MIALIIFASICLSLAGAGLSRLLGLVNLDKWLWLCLFFVQLRIAKVNCVLLRELISTWQTEVANECLELMCQDSGLVIPHFFPSLLSESIQLLVVGYWKHPAVFTQSTVFFHNLLGIVKQLDVGFRSCLLSMDNNPLAFVEKCP